MKAISLAALAVAFTVPACAHSTAFETARLILTFKPEVQTGSVMVSLFDSEMAYTGGAPIRQARIDVEKGERTATFASLKAGDYAVKAFHDVNGDGRMNTNPFGVPVEPVAFSSNAPANMGPASWALARLTLKGETAQTLEIR